ncbi:inhibitor of the KinA pathway to sporulation, predicted exonuclease [Desulfosporosinus acidiphilus SJ4]|uniref:Inhibitor of the KinA pathway to sporulation, predicted exonuclease n=1 Tax=Desulfosporosinus acidiphilus (strain DSM 22704 / JCM 16185 / SJ4) TaxID=646529 RepID=I4D295_DESAJ|nr:3'-5' exonuclease [Desulfosporosinus acidiphilus]AFM39919.1 inhibitor of the KinA pathway to sporulation, predicted exonuclease [Desulfosporosinus acidiphilus SJ4]
MNYVVFDLEFNMFFPFKEGDSANPALKNEIIQIGALKLNDQLEKIDEFNLLVKPYVYKRLNPYVKRKTNINTSKVIPRRPFWEAMESFEAWIGSEVVLCSWGQDDILGLRENCSFFGFSANFFDKYIDIQKIYMKYEGLPQQPSLESAVDSLEIEKALPFHDALSDAAYTVDIFRKVYDFSKDAIINWEKVQRENEFKINELKGLLSQTNIYCPECGNYVAKDKEFSKSKKYFAHGFCQQCKMPIRHVARIINKNGEFTIVCKDNIYIKGESVK